MRANVIAVETMRAPTDCSHQVDVEGPTVQRRSGIANSIGKYLGLNLSPALRRERLRKCCGSLHDISNWWTCMEYRCPAQTSILCEEHWGVRRKAAEPQKRLAPAFLPPVLPRNVVRPIEFVPRPFRRHGPRIRLVTHPQKIAQISAIQITGPTREVCHFGRSVIVPKKRNAPSLQC